MWRARRLHSLRDVHHRHRVFDGDALLAAGLDILVGPAEAWEDERLLAMHDVAAVELGTDLHRQIAIPDPMSPDREVRGCECEVAAKAD
jgi:hypothetical protein